MTVWKLRVWATLPLLLVMGIDQLTGNKERTIPLLAFIGFTWIFVQGFLDLFIRAWRAFHPGEWRTGESKIVPRWLVVTILIVSTLAGMVGLTLSYLIKLS
jgi:hypothetical protein